VEQEEEEDDEEPYLQQQLRGPGKARKTIMTTTRGNLLPRVLNDKNPQFAFFLERKAASHPTRFSAIPLSPPLARSIFSFIEKAEKRRSNSRGVGKVPMRIIFSTALFFFFLSVFSTRSG
jgi:hypothetical protein